MTKYCPKCHRNIKDRNYCPFCGYDPEPDEYQKPLADTLIGTFLDYFPISFTGTMNRRTYAVYSVSVIIVLYLTYLFEIFEYIFDNFYIVILISAITMLFSTVRRLRDIGVSPWLSLLLLVPYGNILFWMFLLFIPGAKRTL